jgi:mRNA interferase RelE/StbE
MAYQIQVQKSARKQLDKIPVAYRIKIEKAIDSLALDPFQGKKLEGELKGQYSIRVWPYRIIYQIYKKELIVSVIDVGHRQGVY